MRREAGLVSPSLTYDHPGVFHRKPVRTAQPCQQGLFSIVTRNPEDPLFPSGGLRFGVSDESGKINLNALPLLDKKGRNRPHWLLASLPGMTEELADSMLNWMQPEGSGNSNADALYYSSRGYAPQPGRPFIAWRACFWSAA